MITPKNLHQSAKKRVVRIIVPANTAGADVADIPIMRAEFDLEIIAVSIIPQVAWSGQDGSNSSVWLIEQGSTSIATKTFDDDPAPPAKGAVADITLSTTRSARKVAEGTVVTYSVTNGTTSATGLTILEIEYVPCDSAFLNTRHDTAYAV